MCFWLLLSKFYLSIYLLWTKYFLKSTEFVGQIYLFWYLQYKSQPHDAAPRIHIIFTHHIFSFWTEKYLGNFPDGPDCDFEFIFFSNNLKIQKANIVFTAMQNSSKYLFSLNSDSFYEKKLLYFCIFIFIYLFGFRHVLDHSLCFLW